MSELDPDEEDCPPAPEFAGAMVKELPIINRKGLHARATAKFVPVSYTHLTLPTILRV